MDSKEIKSLLKQAREAIKDKDFKGALKHCKAVLKVDKDNYNAWVFIGAAAQEIDQAEAAFKKAIEISPNQVLAWQGLLNFYEKHPKTENPEELANIYEKLIELHNDREKIVEICDKLISFLRSSPMNDKKKLVRAFKSKLEAVKGDSVQELDVPKQILETLEGVTDLEDDEKAMQTEALQTLISSETFSEGYRKKTIKSCIEILQKAGEEDYSLTLALLIYKKYPESPSCLEFLGRTAMNIYIYNDRVMDNIYGISAKLNEHPQLKNIALIINGFVCLVSKDFVTAVQKLNEGLQSLEFCLPGWYLLSKSYLLLHRYNESVESTKAGLDVALKSKAPKAIFGKFYILLGQALSGKESWDAAIKGLHKATQILGQAKEVLVPFCLTLLNIQQIDQAEKIYNKMKMESGDNDAEILLVEGYTLLLRKDYENALKTLRQSVALKEYPYTLHLIGLILWETDQREKAFKVFSKAAELDPYFSKNFLYLGHYYQFSLQSKSKAYLCYRKAFKLNPSDIETGMSFSRLLKDLKKKDEDMEVLKIITEEVGLLSCKWAWLQLGLLQLQSKKFTDAVYSFQKFVRADPENSCGWECLADAYLNRGSIVSALKTFMKSSELNPEALYPLYQIASIQKVRGYLTEAVDKYKSLLNTNETYLPALIGLADALILLAKKSLGDCAFGLAKDYCQEAFYILARAKVSSRGQVSCVWKLIGDACVMCFHLDNFWFPITVPSELQDRLYRKPLSGDKYDIIGFSSVCFGRALRIKPKISGLWHDLGVSYYLRCLLAPSTDENMHFTKKAFICFQKAISISPNCEAHWSSLGIVAIKSKLQDYCLGQHCLIKSLKINKDSASNWTNLGFLYLENGNIKLANAAFSRAQATDPTYSLCWYGQACIAEQINDYETIDLYRHAATLSSHRQVLIGYSKVICESILHKEHASYVNNKELMSAFTVATDYATKVAANASDHAGVSNMLGILLERQGVYNASLKFYKRAVDLLTDSDNLEWKESAIANYARLLRVVGEPQESIKEYLRLQKVDLDILCGFALTLYKAKEYKKAFMLYDKAYDKATSSSDKSHIKVIMAMIARYLTSPEFPTTLTLLFESSQIQPPSVYGLMALCAYGLLNNDLELTIAAEQQLQPYKQSAEHAFSIAYLCGMRAFKEKGIKPGRNELLKFVHSFPYQGNMWLQMASCILQWNKDYAQIAAKCTKVGTFHNGCKEQASQIFALCQLSFADRKAALSAAQKAVHINPGGMLNWATLASACHVSNRSSEHAWIFNFVKKLAKEQGIKPDLLGSLIALEAFQHVVTGNITAANILTTRALTKTVFNSEIQSVLHILDGVVKVHLNLGNLEPLVIAVKNNPTSLFGWHVLCHMLLFSNKFSEAEKVISQFGLTSAKHFPQWMPLALLHLAVLSYKAMHTSNEDKEKWLKLGINVTGKAVHLSPQSSAARFLQGIFAIESRNLSLARRSFENVLSNPKSKDEEWVKKSSENILAKKIFKYRGKR